MAGTVVATTIAVGPVSAAPSTTATPSCTITGTDGPDVLTGTPGADVLCGRNGDDTLIGLGGDDVLIGGTGYDRLEGGDGDDTLLGGNEGDTLLGGSGDDTLTGGTGDDQLDGGAGNDQLAGENDHDTLVGGEGDDVLTGATGEDRLDGGAGTDMLDGGNDADLLVGGDGPDQLVAGHGADNLEGGRGDDTLDGGPDADRCDGATGSNTFLRCESTVEDPTPEEPLDPQADTDADGLPDALEERLGSSLTGSDTDADGLGDAAEFDTATDPVVADTDGDGVLDGADDTDGDTRTNAEELAAGTHPARSDTDGDGLDDGQELAAGTDPLLADTDGEGLGDHDEVLVGSDPTLVDTDGDEVSDAEDTFDRAVTDDTTGARLDVSGTAAQVLGVRLDPAGDERLEGQAGVRGPPVDLELPEGAGGTLTLPFDTTGLDENAYIAAFRLDEETGTLAWTPHATDLDAGEVRIDVGAGHSVPTLNRAATASEASAARESVGVSAGEVCLPGDPAAFLPRNTYVVLDVREFEQIWKDQIEVPRDKHEHIDVVLTLDSSGSMVWNDPEGARRTAATAYVDALLGGDRAAVVDFDDQGYVTQPLTEDRAAARDAIAAIDDVGGTHIAYAVQAALGELDQNGDPKHQRVIVLLTDGEGPYWQELTDRAAATGTVVYTVGLGPSTDTALLSGIAEATGGQFYLVLDADDLEGIFEDIRDRVGDVVDGDTGVADTDGDGLSDAAETAGMRTGTGALYRTDPTRDDTDGDGLTDGDEMGSLCSTGAFGAGTYYRAKADPTRADSDRDGLDDWYEVANTSYPFKADFDRDGLNDHAELMVHGTEPLSEDTDADGFADDWEIDNTAAGFDPRSYDETYEWWEYAGDFSRGALCGDVSGVFGFCDGDSVPYVVGAITAGIAGVGDIRDGLANLAKGDLVAAGLSLGSLVPVAGDAASVVTKSVKFLKQAVGTRAAALTRHVAHAGYLPRWAKIQVLDLASDGAVASIKSRGLVDADVLAFARRGIPAQHLRKILDAAEEVRPAAGRFRLEDAAERTLRADLPSPITGRPGRAITPGGPRNQRYLDVIDTELRTGFEVKHGYVDEAGRAGVQLSKDAQMVSTGAAPDIDRIEWHFFANSDGLFGPDEFLLQDLINNGIPFVIHLP
ncbi:VWA domain-containing protein [Cellulomonas pakistanensis]|uniref:VWA domain-containing protein n=1 Tax=Cellulomonas pakistanensis TaxID=992287 RepID=UPI0019443AF5|nr:VWA domain-containing protein [Cellulomonas pakistanensis]